VLRAGIQPPPFCKKALKFPPFVREGWEGREMAEGNGNNVRGKAWVLSENRIYAIFIHMGTTTDNSFKVGL